MRDYWLYAVNSRDHDKVKEDLMNGIGEFFNNLSVLFQDFLEEGLVKKVWVD